MVTSCQPRPQPHRTGTAARTARNGTTMKVASRICSIRAWAMVPGTYASGAAALRPAARAALPALAPARAPAAASDAAASPVGLFGAVVVGEVMGPLLGVAV